MATVNPQLTTINFWKTFDLLKFQKELDQVALEIANRQDESDLSRQKLVEQSREFKKNTPEDVKKYVGPLFKNFQQEIDSLSKRSKSGEAAFLAVYKQIIDFVDPSPLIEQCERLQKSTQKVKDLELENKLLRDTLEDCNKELAAAKQTEETVKKLEKKLKETDKNITTITEVAVMKIREELESEFAGKLAESGEEKAGLTSTIDHLKGEITMLRTSFDSVNTELHELRSKYEDYLLAKNCEIDMMAGDIEKLHVRAQMAETECEKLRKNAGKEALSGQYTDQESALRIDKLEKEIENKENEVRHLIDEINGMKLNYSHLEQTFATKIAFLEEHVDQKNLAYEQLERRLSTMADYSAIKRELSILKSMEFSEGEINSSDGFKGEKEKPLEVLVMEKNKTLKVENSTLRSQKAQMTDDDDASIEPNATTPTCLEVSGPTSDLTRGEDRSTTGGLAVPSTKTLHQIANYYAKLFSKWESNPVPKPPSSNCNVEDSAVALASKTPAPSSETKNDTPTFQQRCSEMGSISSRDDLTTTKISKPSSTTAHVNNLASSTTTTTTTNFRRSITTTTTTTNQNEISHSLPSPLPYNVSPTPQTQHCSTDRGLRSSPSITPQLAQHHIPSPPSQIDDCDDKATTLKHSSDLGPSSSQESATCEDALQPCKESANPSNAAAAPRLPMTDDIAKTVREALCFHQIGQRVFAKYILGLSQGTVSELLSKPKPWERLSGKGRESYRKMYAWVSDPTAILALKSLAPKRAKEMPQNGVAKKEDKQTKEKIVDILCKAQKAMMHKDCSASEEGSPFPTLISPQPMPPKFAHNGDYEATLNKNGNSTDGEGITGQLLNGSVSNGEEEAGAEYWQAKQPLSQKTIMISKNGEREAVTGTSPHHDQSKTLRSPSTTSSSPLSLNRLSSGSKLDTSAKDLGRSTYSNALPYSDSKIAPFENVNLATAFMYKMISAFKNPDVLGYRDACSSLNQYASKPLDQGRPYNILTSPKSHDDSAVKNDDCDDLNCCPTNCNDSSDKIKLTHQQDDNVRGRSHNENSQAQHHPFYNYAHQIYQHYKGGGPRNEPHQPYTSPIFAPHESIGNGLDPNALTSPVNLAEYYRSQWETFYNRRAHPALQHYENGLDLEEISDQEEAKPKTNGCSAPYNHNGNIFTPNSYCPKVDEYNMSQAMWANIIAAHSNQLHTPPTQSPLNLSTRKKEENSCHSSQPYGCDFKERGINERSRTHSSCSTSDSRVSTGSNTSPLGKIHSITMSIRCTSPHSPAITHPKTTSPWQSVPRVTPSSSSRHGLTEPAISIAGATMGCLSSSSTATNNNNNNNNNVGTKSSKSSLPPVPQELFAARSNLNTEDIVRRVKEHLAKYSISQRAFGEMVLGLSQGSVSDLLARPKPWSLLTQKGREPFIRMQIFLDDGKFTLPLSASIHKRSSSSAAANATNSHNTTSITSNGICDSNGKESEDLEKVSNVYDKPKTNSKLTKDQPKTSLPSAEANLDTSDPFNWHNDYFKGDIKAHEISPASSEGKSMNDRPVNDSQNSRGSINSPLTADDKCPAPSESNGLLMTPLTNKVESEDMCQDSSIIFNDSLGDQKISGFNDKNSVQNTVLSGEDSINAANKTAHVMGPSPIFPSPGHLMELTAVSGNLDTLQLTSRIKEILINFNIGQKVFGEAVLGLSQGSVSELLSKPKPWHMLSLKGREPFIRMHFWLNDVENIEKLKSLKQKKKSHTATPSQSSLANGSGSGKRKQRFQHSNSEEEGFKAIDAYGTTAIHYPRTLSHSNTPSPLFKNYFKQTPPDYYGKSIDDLPKPFMVPPHYSASDFNGSPSQKNDLNSPVLAFSSGYDFFDDDEDDDQISNGGALDNHIAPRSPKGSSSPGLRLQASGKKLLGTAVGGSPKKWFTSFHHSVGTRLPTAFKSKRPSLPLSGSSGHGSSLQRSTFSLAQKAILKQVYRRDSYPSTDTISALAIEFNVPPRSIINWFHNYRMRLKAQICPPTKIEHQEDQPAIADKSNDIDHSKDFCDPSLNSKQPSELVDSVENIEMTSHSIVHTLVHEKNVGFTLPDVSQAKGANDFGGRRVNKRKANVPTKVEHKKSLKTDNLERDKSPLLESERVKSPNILWGHPFEPCQNEYQRNSASEAKMLDPTTPSYMMTSLMP